MPSTPLTDAWGREVSISNGLFRYRNRAIDVSAFSEIRVKGRRVLVNHYKENTFEPKAIIICKDIDSANVLYEYILKKAFQGLSEDDGDGDCDGEEDDFALGQLMGTYKHMWQMGQPSIVTQLPTVTKPDTVIDTPPSLRELPQLPPYEPLTLWQYLGCSRRSQNA